MTKITIRELQSEPQRWVRRAAQEKVVITEDGRELASGCLDGRAPDPLH